MIPGPQYRRELFAVMGMGNPLPKITHQKRETLTVTVLAKSRVELQHRRNYGWDGDSNVSEGFCL